MEFKERSRPIVAALLVRSSLVLDGDRIEFRGRMNRNEDAVRQWIREDPRRGFALWRPNERTPLEWARDGKLYSLTNLARKILESATGHQVGALRGPLCWAKGGRTLVEIAASCRHET